MVPEGHRDDDLANYNVRAIISLKSVECIIQFDWNYWY